MSAHSQASLGARHPPHNWEYANAAARTGATGLVALDVGKKALQLDNNTEWRLLTVAPTWKQVDGGGGVTTPGTTIDKGVTIWGGTTGSALEDAGVRNYGKSATDPTPPPTPSDGDRYYNTALKMWMTYDGARSKWLGDRGHIWFGRSGNTGTGSYYRGPGNRLYSSSIGRMAEHNGTVISISITRNDTDAATFEVTADGIAIAELASSAVKGKDITLNANFNADAVLGARNKAGGNTTTHVHGWAVWRWRI